MPYVNYPPKQQGDFPNSGTMHLREKKSPRAADMGGDFVIEADVLEYILQQANGGARQVKLEVSAWRRMGRNNNQFWSLKIQTPWSERQQDSPRGGYQNQRDDYERGRGGYRDQDRRELQGDGRDFRRDERSSNDYRGNEPDERSNQTNGRNPYAEQRGETRANPYEGGRTDFRGTGRRETPQQFEQRNREFSKGDSLPDFGPPKGTNRPPF